MKKKLTNFLKNDLVNKSVKVLVLRIIGTILFFGLTLFLTNNFDAGLVGQYDFIRSFLIFIGAIALLGMQQSIIYFSGYLLSIKRLYEIKKIYFKMCSILFVTTATLIALFFMFSTNKIDMFFNKHVSDIIFKALLALVFYGLTIFNIEAFRAIDKLFFSEILRSIFRYLFFFLFAIFLSQTHNNNFLVNAFLINFLLLSFLSTGVLLFHFSKLNYRSNDEFTIGYRDIIKRSVPMAISSIAFLLMQSIDLILIGKFLDFNQVAYYAVTVKLTMIISLVLTSVNTIIAPKISELYSSKKYNLLQFYIKQATRIIFILTIPGIIILIVFSTYVLSFFGNQYIIAKQALWVLLIGQAVNALCGSVGIYMNMTGKQNTLQKILLSALTINIFLNWIFIPKFGITGAAMATSVSMIAWNIIGVLYLYNKDRIKTYIS